MAVNIDQYKALLAALNSKTILVAVSKTKPIADIQALYDLGQRDFGENYVQELVDKEAVLPKDINWHFIGHLQSNKVKAIAPFVHLIHGVDSIGLLKEIDKQAAKNNRVIDCLLQMHIAMEETKFGLDAAELSQIMSDTTAFKNVRLTGLMGMASFTTDKDLVRTEFKQLRELFKTAPQFSTLSMGMSGDFKIAEEEGSNMVRIGSLLFGERNYKPS